MCKISTMYEKNPELLGWKCLVVTHVHLYVSTVLYEEKKVYKVSVF